jgi:DNA-binding transcriptional MerR regulator
MKKLIPGTTIPFSGSARDSAFSAVQPVLDATGGLTLSQLSKLTGLGGTTIQNWIKRGWVSSPKGKKYSDKQVLRILLINMLKDSMKLDDIARLMAYVNGDVDDNSDDIIADIHLYNMLCRIVFTAEDQGVSRPERINQLIDDEIELHSSDIANAAKLRKAMFVMVTGYGCGVLKRQMDEVLTGVLEEQRAGSLGK